MKPSSIEILFITGADPDNGAPHQLMAALCLARKDFQVRMFAASARCLSRAIATPLGTVPCRSHPIGPSVLRKLLWQLQLFKVVSRARFFSNSIFYIQGHVGTVAAFFALLGTNKSRLIYHTQDYLEPGRHPFWAFFERRIVRKAGHIICNEINRARFMMSNYQLDKLPLIVRTALPSEWPVPEFDESVRAEILKHGGMSDTPATKLVLHQGPFSNVRCSQKVVEAMTMLSDDYVLIFTGMGPETISFRQAQKIISAVGIEKRVIYLGDVQYDNLLRYTACCDIGLLLYPDDGIGNFYQAPGRLTEYLRCGLPVVTSNSPGFEILTLKYGIGIACNQESSSEIAAAILRLGNRSDDQKTRERIRLIELAKTELAYESQAWQIEDIIKNMQGEL